jgi:polysaccharide deacetylase family protein (PEP-CTERM system associated)
MALLSEAAASLVRSRAMRNALTFDLEEYFHAEAFTGLVSSDDWTRLGSRIRGSTLRLLDSLERWKTSATFFVLGWLADRHPALVREIHARGHEVACHGYMHRLIYRMGREAFQADVRRAKRAIEDAIGARVRGYRAPTFSVVRETLWALDVLAEEGFAYDSSIFPIHHDRYGIPGALRFPHRVKLPGGGHIAEFPISTLSLAGQRFPFSGGGYFRLAPYPMVRRALRHVNRREGMPGLVYLHPWEMDPGQPRLALRRLPRLRHYVNLRHTARKLDRLLADFTFAPAGQVLCERGIMEAAS